MVSGKLMRQILKNSHSIYHRSFHSESVHTHVWIKTISVYTYTVKKSLPNFTPSDVLIDPEG